MKNKKVQIDTKDVYQLLIANLRYGYTRNNHLMPSTAYPQTKEIINNFFKVDEQYALHTLKQICEECISDEICTKFYDGLDDEFGNRNEAIEFVNWCLDKIDEYEIDWQPYNYDDFNKNIRKDYLNLYSIRVKENDTFVPYCISSKSEYMNVIMNDILKVQTTTYTRERISDLPEDVVESYIYHFKSPKQIDIKVSRFKESILNEKD